MIDIKNILNFRFSPDFYMGHESWIGEFDENPRDDVIDMLTTPPDVFSSFTRIFHRCSVTCQAKNTLKCNNVFCLARHEQIAQLIDIVSTNKQEYDNLVIAGTDKPLSMFISQLKIIKNFFKNIYYEAKDVDCDWIKIIPMGLNRAYTLRCGHHNITPHINNIREKTKLLGCAFGSKWPNITTDISDRQELANIIKTSSLIEDFKCAPREYFSVMKKYQFIACPLGNGVQTPKICESILCEAIPVMTDHHCSRELRDRYKLPILIVKRWSDITEQMLRSFHKRLTYTSMDWSQIKQRFLSKNFENFLI